MALEPKTFIKNAKFTVSLQAQKMLAHTSLSAKDLVEWYISKGIGIGGNDVVFFLGDMYDKINPEEFPK